MRITSLRRRTSRSNSYSARSASAAVRPRQNLEDRNYQTACRHRSVPISPNRFKMGGWLEARYLIQSIEYSVIRAHNLLKYEALEWKRLIDSLKAPLEQVY